MNAFFKESAETLFRHCNKENCNDAGMLTIIIADAELETIPEKMQGDHAIRKYSKEKGKPVNEVILDSNYMHTSIDRYFPGESSRRGRPDIIYILLQVAMESILNKNGMLRIFVHTRNDICITVNPRVRLPKSYNRFIGLMESLFKKGEISSDGEVLLKADKMDAGNCIEKNRKGDLVILSPDGEKAKLYRVISGDKDYTVIIGGFPEGDYVSDVYPLAGAYSIFREELTIWSVASEVISQYERAVDLV